VPPGGCKTGGGKGCGVGGKIKWRLSTAVSKGQDEFVGKFKMAADDVISIRGQVLKHTYIPTGIERELVRFGMDGDRKG
jgi:hypothetical protein